MGKHVSPLLGYNNNVRHKNRVFHIQTEDSGVKHPHIITHLFMDGGRILKSVKRSYAEHVGADGMQDIVKQLMKEQHKAMFIALRDGQFDHLLETPAASAPPDKSKGAPSLAPASLAPATVQSPPSPPVAPAAAAPPVAPVAATRSAGRTDPAPPPVIASGPASRVSDDVEMVPKTTRVPEHAVAARGVSERPPPVEPRKPPSKKPSHSPPPPAVAAVNAGGLAAAAPARVPHAPPLPTERTPPAKPVAPAHVIVATAAAVAAKPVASPAPVAAKSVPADNRYAAARPAAIFGQSRPPAGSSLFGEDLISDKSLDEVILSYLAEDLEPRDPKK